MISDHSNLSRGCEPGGPHTPVDEELSALFGGPAHPTMMRLESVLKDNDAAAPGELEHIAICPDCIARVKAFRRLNDHASRRRLHGSLNQLRDSQSDYARDAETDARFFYVKFEQDADLERWQHDAWRCSHTIARALRHARLKGAGVDDLKAIIRFRVAALGSAAAHPMVASSRLFDAAWPIAEMVKEAAIEVGFIGPALFGPFAEAVGAAVRIASPKMKVVIAYGAVEMLERGFVSQPLAVKIIRKIAAADSSRPMTTVLAACLHRQPLGVELRSILSADFVNEPRIHAGFRTLVRRWHKAEQIVNDETITLQNGISRLLAIVRRYLDDILDADQPGEAMLRLIAFRRFLDRLGRYVPDNHFPMSELFREIGHLLIAVANQRGGSTFLIAKALEVLRDADPHAFAALADDLPSIRPVVRQCLIASAAAGYETTFNGNVPAKIPAFIRNGRTYVFTGAAGAHPLDAFCRRAAEQAAAHPAIGTHLEWMNERMKTWTREVTAAVKS